MRLTGRMLRGLGRSRESGAGAAQYAALVVLAALILGGLVAAGIPGAISGGVRSTICQIFQGGDCGGPRANGGRDGSGGENAYDYKHSDDGGGQDSDGSNGQDGDGSGDQSGDDQDGDEPTLGDLQDQADAAQEELDGANDEYGGLEQQIIDLLKDFIGITDVEECIGDGDIASCLWAAFDVGSLFFAALKVGKFAKAVKKSVKLWKKYNKGRKVITKAKKAAKDAKNRLRKKRVACGLPANSFTAGTPVLLADGRRVPIEDVRIGDRVRAVDPETGMRRAEPVTRLIRGTGTKHLVRLRVAANPYGLNGDTIVATTNHPFWVPARRTWTDAGNLTLGTRLGNGHGGHVRVLDRTTFTRRTTVYNLTIADLHTYQIGAAGQSLLVHNEEGCPTYSGDLEKVAKADPDADKLAERISGESRVKFENDPDMREFDAVSDDYIAQAKPANFQINKKFRSQAKATFEAAKQTGRKVYFHFDGPPEEGVIKKIHEYESRYGIEAKIDTESF